MEEKLAEFETPFQSKAIQRDLGWHAQIGWRDIRAEAEGR